MKEAYHYTSNENWDKIQESGLLLPKSKPFGSLMRNRNIKISERVSNIIRDNRYLVAVSNPEADDWKEYDLRDALLDKNHGEVLLKVPILDTEGSFVRDHAHFSPKRFLELYGEDLVFNPSIQSEINSFYMGLLGIIGLRDFAVNHNLDVEDPRIKMGLSRYYESTKKLSDYTGDYKVEEIWLNQKTPLNLIERIEI